MRALCADLGKERQIIRMLPKVLNLDKEQSLYTHIIRAIYTHVV